MSERNEKYIQEKLNSLTGKALEIFKARLESDPNLGGVFTGDVISTEATPVSIQQVEPEASIEKENDISPVARLYGQKNRWKPKHPVEEKLYSDDLEQRQAEDLQRQILNGRPSGEFVPKKK